MKRDAAAWSRAGSVGACVRERLSLARSAAALDVETAPTEIAGVGILQSQSFKSGIHQCLRRNRTHASRIRQAQDPVA